MALHHQLTAVAGGPDDEMEEVALLGSYDDEGDEEAGAEDGGMWRVQVRVAGMTCSAYTGAVEAAVSARRGVRSAAVSLLQSRARVVFDPALVKSFTSMLKAYCVKEEDDVEAIEDAGFEAEILPDTAVSQPKSQKTLSGQFRIGGMTCAACVNSVEGTLIKLSGVKRAVVALATSLGEVEYDPTAINKDEIVQAIEDAGFEAALLQSSEQDKVLFGLTGLYTERDAGVLHDILKKTEGLWQFDVKFAQAELEIVFDLEVIGLRSIVDTIDIESNGKFKAHVVNQYIRTASNDAQEASKIAPARHSPEPRLSNRP